MDHRQLAQAIYETAHVSGSFKLRSGQTSDHYFDKYMFECDPELLQAIADKLRPLIPANTAILAGLELGGIPIATALSLATGIPAVFVRKQAKAYGTAKLAEGKDVRGQKVCIIEDVVTTGGQVMASAADLKRLGADVGHALCVIERNPEGRQKLEEAGFALTSLFTMDDLIGAGSHNKGAGQK